MDGFWTLPRTVFFKECIHAPPCYIRNNGEACWRSERSFVLQICKDHWNNFTQIKMQIPLLRKKTMARIYGRALKSWLTWICGLTPQRPQHPHHPPLSALCWRSWCSSQRLVPYPSIRGPTPPLLAPSFVRVQEMHLPEWFVAHLSLLDKKGVSLTLSLHPHPSIALFGGERRGGELQPPRGSPLIPQ